MSGERMDVVEGMKAIRDAGYVLLSPEQVAQVREMRAVAERKRIAYASADAALLAISWAGRVLALDDVLALLDDTKEER